MKTQHIAICEKKSYLTASLEREFLYNSDLTFRWLPYRKDFFKYLRTHHCDLAIFDDDNFQQSHLNEIQRVASRIDILAFAPEGDLEFEFLLREIGVCSVLPNGIHFPALLSSVKTLLQHR